MERKISKKWWVVQGSNLRPDDYFTTLAFASRRFSRRCSLDWLIAHSFYCLGVRRTVSEGFFKSLKVAC